MTVYVLAVWFKLDGENLAIFDHYNKAFEFAEKRYGRPLEWVKHDSHGVSWTARDIDGLHKFSVEEFEVRT